MPKPVAAGAETSASGAGHADRLAELVAGVIAGDRRATARALSLADAAAPEALRLERMLAPHCGRAASVGITGPPGAGKSTLVNALIAELRKRGKRVGVIAVDPSSPLSGGALLGDRVRMAAGDADEGVFIRSLASRGHLGGLSRSTARAAMVLDAAGYDIVIIETVGAGQSEVEIAGLAGSVVVVLPPGLGDDVQAIKAGILEIADVLVVNKGDLPGAERTEGDLRAMLRLRAPGRRGVPVLRTVATTGAGVAALADALGEHVRSGGPDRAAAVWHASPAPMPPRIEFRKETKLAYILDPRQNFAEVAVESEVRFDPLTAATSRICHFSMSAAPPEDLAALAAASASQCPFCEDAIARVTPRYPDGLIAGGGRLARGEAVLFPNLFPYDDFSAVAVMSRAHFLPMDALPARNIEDALLLAREFVALAAGSVAKPGEHYGMVCWNYMPPSGATQVHPHLQVVLTRHPGNALRRELEASSLYRNAHGRCFSADLTERERGGPRWIGESGRIAWHAPFAPSGVLGDCCAVFPGCATLASVSDDDIADFARGLVQVLRGFAGLGLWSFNLTLFPEAEGSGAERHWLTARVVPRLYLNPLLHVPDVAYLQLQLDERYAMRFPEATARALKQAFAA